MTLDPHSAASFSTVEDAPPAFHLLAKPTGAVCNLDCSYCFFLSKEMLYPGSRFRMADELLEAYLRELIESHRRVPEVTIAWQGGEPTLMGLDFFRRSIELAERYLQPGQRAEYSIQTNGTLLDAEWAEFFREHDFLVGISIDGSREVHDAYRVNKGGKGSIDQVMRGLAFLQEYGVEYNSLTTLHSANADRGAEVYRFLRDECGSRFHQYIPIIERVSETGEDGGVPWTSWRDRPLYVQEGEHVTGRSVTAGQYGRFLIDVFEEWVRRDVGEVYVQMFDVALVNWVGEPPSLCIQSETCGFALALEHTGDLYSCDHFVEPRHKLGNIQMAHMLELVPSQQQRSSGSTSARGSLATASTATFASPATAAARRTASSRRLTASPASTISARATRTSFTTSTAQCASWPSSCAGGTRPPRSWPSTRQTTHVVDATTRALVAPDGSGSTATAQPRHDSPRVSEPG